MDQRNQILAEKLINYSVKLKPGENILIEANGGEGLELVDLLVKETYKAGGVPFVNIINSRIMRDILINATEEQIKLWAELDCEKMKKMQAYIAVRSPQNQRELSDVPSDKQQLYAKFYNEPVNIKIRVPHTKWCVLTYASAGSAQESNMSTESYEDFYYNVCNLDYEKMSRAMDSLVSLMNKTDRVHIKSPTCDLKFSIKSIPTIKCDGACNIPDGEIYTAPVKDSVNGYILYNTPSIYQGFTYDNVRLEFKDGKIVDATANDTARINQVFDTDEGARYIGEFALGVNPYILEPAMNTLFDEKICGSFHFTPGACYDEAPNSNKSAIHWDLVCIQRQEYGGGEIYFDDVLVRKDGLFILPELECLNPDNLK